MATDDMHEIPLVGILMGSDSDWPTMEAATKLLRDFDIPFEASVKSAHRTPCDVAEYADSAYERGLRVIICGAGQAAHLAGVVAAHTPLPVIGVPIASGPLRGQDALYATVQMPPGVPVATVGIGNAKNAAILAIQILGTAEERCYRAVENYKAVMVESARRKTIPDTGNV